MKLHSSERKLSSIKGQYLAVYRPIKANPTGETFGTCNNIMNSKLKFSGILLPPANRPTTLQLMALFKTLLNPSHHRTAIKLSHSQSVDSRSNIALHQPSTVAGYFLEGSENEERNKI